MLGTRFTIDRRKQCIFCRNATITRGWFVCQLSSPSISAVSTVPKSTTTTRTTTATAKQQSQPQPSSQLVGNQNAWNQQHDSVLVYRQGHNLIMVNKHQFQDCHHDTLMICSPSISIKLSCTSRLAIGYNTNYSSTTVFCEYAIEWNWTATTATTTTTTTATTAAECPTATASTCYPNTNTNITTNGFNYQSQIS